MKGNGYNLLAGSQNLEEVLGGNFKSINLGIVPKMTEFDNDSQIDESCNENNKQHEYSSYGKIYEENNEGISSSNCNEKSCDQNQFNSTRNFFDDPNVKMSNARLRPMSINEIDFNLPIRQQEIIKTKEKNETLAKINRKSSDDSEKVCKINNRVQNAIRRIEKKYCHKNTLTTNETNVFEKLNTKSPFEKIDIFEDQKNKDSNPNNLILNPNATTNNSIHPTKIQSTSLYNFDTSLSHSFKARNSNTNILQSDLISDSYKNKGYDYLDKLKEDELKRTLKANHDMDIMKDKIFELQNLAKEKDSQLRNTFYNCLQEANQNNKYKDKNYYQMNPQIQKLVNINNSGYKYDVNESKLSTNSGQKNNSLNMYNTSQMFNTKSGHFKKPIGAIETKEQQSNTVKLKSIKPHKDQNIETNNYVFANEKLVKVTNSVNFDTNRSLKHNQLSNKNSESKDINKYSISRYAKNLNHAREKSTTKTVKKEQKINSQSNSYVYA